MNNYNRYNHINNNIFWKTVKPFFTDKGVNHDRSLLLEEDDKTISDNDEISENINNFFAGIVKNLIIPQYEDQSYLKGQRKI